MKDCFLESISQRTKKGKDYLVWQEGYHAKQIETNQFLEEKLDYIHNNPVESGFVSLPEDYLYSSARNYSGEQGVFNVELLQKNIGSGIANAKKRLRYALRLR